MPASPCIGNLHPHLPRPLSRLETRLGEEESNEILNSEDQYAGNLECREPLAPLVRQIRNCIDRESREAKDDQHLKRKLPPAERDAPLESRIIMTASRSD
jgi:hypothetical protein